MTPAKRRALNVGAVVTILGVATVVAGAVMHAGRGMGQVEGNSGRLTVQEAKIHEIEIIVTETHTIVSRIDRRLDREHPID